MFRTAACAGIVAVAVGLLPSACLAEDLTAGEIRDELIGHSILWWEDGGWRKGYLVLAPDGSAEISVDHPHRQGDRGRWTLRGGEICTAWQELRSGSEKCYAVRRSDGGRFVTTGGNIFEVREAGV